jgi:hypothetical protein
MQEMPEHTPPGNPTTHPLMNLAGLMSVSVDTIFERLVVWYSSGGFKCRFVIGISLIEPSMHNLID